MSSTASSPSTSNDQSKQLCQAHRDSVGVKSWYGYYAKLDRYNVPARRWFMMQRDKDSDPPPATHWRLICAGGPPSVQYVCKDCLDHGLYSLKSRLPAIDGQGEIDVDPIPSPSSDD